MKDLDMKRDRRVKSGDRHYEENVGNESSHDAAIAQHHAVNILGWWLFIRESACRGAAAGRS